MKLKTLKGSALGYAISFLLLVGLICSGVLFTASVNKRLERIYSISEHLLFDNYLALQTGARGDKLGTFYLAHPSGDSSTVTVRNWGVFRAVSVKTFHGKMHEQKSAIIGDRANSDQLSIYLPNNNQSLKLAGETKLSGRLFLPERGVERGYLSGHTYDGETLYQGEHLQSDRQLPEIDTYYRDLSIETFRSDLVPLNWTENDTVFSFHETGRLISSLYPIVLNKRLVGQIVIHSFDSIFVQRSAQLEHVILIAPKIHFEEGFRGTVQAIAHETIICERDVNLAYPSVLVLNEREFNVQNKLHGIFLNDHSKLLGGALLVSQNSNFRNLIRFSLENALVAGSVYNQGESQIQGTIAGRIYTNQFYLTLGGGTYINHLMNATISEELLPKEFVGPHWMQPRTYLQPEILACF